MDFLAGLNPQQREAVEPCRRPAAAARRRRQRQNSRHHAPHRASDRGPQVPGPAVLAVTFTNKAADEMRERVNSACSSNADHREHAHRFHFPFLLRPLLRRDGGTLGEIRPGFTRQFTIYDDDDQVALVEVDLQADWAG